MPNQSRLRDKKTNLIALREQADRTIGAASGRLELGLGFWPFTDDYE